MENFRISKTFRGMRPVDKDGRDGLANPERGFRFEIGVGRIPSDMVKVAHVRDQWPFPRYRRDGVVISQAYCYLTQFHSSEISDEKLAALQADFDRARRDGVKFLFRFAYEYDGVKEGPTAERILAHIRQLTPIVRDNADVIYVLQIGWVGLWGEFHTSVHGISKDPKAVADIVAATLEMLPPGHPTMMRRMAYRRAVLGTLGVGTEVTSANAWSSEPAARIGFFNDGTLANWWDGGTFTTEPYAETGDEDFDEVARYGRYLPVDGELFWTGQYSHPAFACGLRAIDRFTRHHYTTLSLVHGFSELDQRRDPWTIDGWKVTPVTPDELAFFGIRFDPAYFEGVPHRTAFEFIRDHLGYRLAATKADFSGDIAPGGAFEASVTLRNYGFSTPVKPRRPEFVLASKSGEAVEIPVEFDCRQLQPCAEGATDGSVLDHEIRLATSLPASMPEGPYCLGIWFPDPSPSLRYRPEYAIRLATALPTTVVGGRLLNVLN